ncbi:MAG: DUF4251 domain-containing protein [Breznakibacter sp.]
MKKIVIVLLSGLLTTGLAPSQKKADKQALREKQYHDLIELIHTKQYRFEAQRAIPTQFRPVHTISAPNTLTINDSVAIAELPFFGRAYYAEYGSTEGGIRFNGEILEYNVVLNDKRRSIDISFKVKSTNDQFQIRMEMFGMDDCNVGVTSNNRAFISYQGSIGPIGKD